MNGESRTKDFYGFGRKDRLDEETLVRLVDSGLMYTGEERADCLIIVRN